LPVTVPDPAASVIEPNWKGQGLLLLVAAPSGTGKSTLCARLRREFPIRFSISCTTRPPRVGEEHGREYYFLDRNEFEHRIHAGDFLEYAEVHGNLYGTLREEVLQPMRDGRDVLLDIDTAGAAQVRNCRDDVLEYGLTDIFIMPPSLEELARRLRGRGTDAEDQIRRRLETARQEMLHWEEFRFLIVSGDREADYEKFRAIYLAQHCRTGRRRPPEEVLRVIMPDHSGA
jgi:guanylate kinase